MIQARTFILYSTIAGLFGTALYFHVGPVMIQGFYLLMLMNLVLMLVIKRLWIPPGMLIFLGLLCCTSVVGMLRGVDTLPRFIKEFLGISVTVFYFCSFFRTVNFDFEETLLVYTRMAYWVAVFGLIIYPFRFVLEHEYRLRSILTEPSMFVLTCIPALYFFADRWQRSRIYGRELAVMLVAFVMAGSSNGFLGILFGLAIFVMRYRKARFLLPGALVALASIFYFAFADVALRIDDSLRVVRDADLTGSNFSTWALFSNGFVTQQVLQAHPFLGNGLGSHGLSYERYIGTVTGADDFTGTFGEGLNAEDANSLALRVLSDMGLIGGALVIWFIWYYRPKGNSDSAVMSRAMWLYFFVKLLRGGQYFSNEQYFFILFYALSNTRFANLKEVGRPKWLASTHRLSMVSMNENDEGFLA